MRIFGLPGHVIRNAGRASRLLGAKTERLRCDVPMWGKDKLGPLLSKAGFIVSNATVGSILESLVERGNKCGGIVFIHLDVDKATAQRRVPGRKGHFMPASLVESQFADLEPPTTDEAALTLDASRPVAELVSASAKFLQMGEYRDGSARRTTQRFNAPGFGIIKPVGISLRSRQGCARRACQAARRKN
jgi:hypothetical protein